jgi:hypothetical protein
MNLLLGKLLCKLRGHKRGVRLPENTHRMPDGTTVTPVSMMFRCPRCHSTWTRNRKVKDTDGQN